MKKVILSAAIVLGLVTGIKNIASAAAPVSQEISTVLPDVKNISEIEIHGNVQVYLTSGDKENVKVYGDYYAENALVQEQNNVLRITSYSAEKLVVWVTVADLAKLSVFDNADVKSFGKFTTLDLQVNLYNNATAQLDMNVINASFNVKNNAVANLTGDIENGNLQYDRSAMLNMANLNTAENLIKTVNQREIPVKHGHHGSPFII